MSQRLVSCKTLAIGAVMCGLVVSAGCSSSQSAATTEAKTAASPTPPLWGDMKALVSVKELMKHMIDPASDYIFESVGTDVTSAGAVERAPKTEEDWDRIRTGAITLAEGAYLLKVPRPFAPAGDLNDSIGPNAPELAPDQIAAKREADPVEWNARIETLRNVGLEVLEIAKKKDAQELWNAGADLDNACENCHLSYWYPGQNEAFYEKLNKQVFDLLASPLVPAGGKPPERPAVRK